MKVVVALLFALPATFYKSVFIYFLQRIALSLESCQAGGPWLRLFVAHRRGCRLLSHPCRGERGRGYVGLLDVLVVFFHTPSVGRRVHVVVCNTLQYRIDTLVS